MSKAKLIFELILVSSLLLIAGCDFNKISKTSSPIVVKIPWKEKGQTHYSVQNVELRTVHNLSPLEGEAANIFFKPNIFSDHIGGKAFELEFTYTAKKEVIPLNRLSAQALTLYAHMERLFLWSSSLNLPQDLKTKLDVGLAAEFSDNGAPLRNNALFSSLLNSMLVVPYTQSSIPLSLNGGVLAHEYFHFLFNGLVLKPLGAGQNNTNPALLSPHEEVSLFGESLFSIFNLNIEKSIDLSTQSNSDLNNWIIFSFVRAMNEGLADVWGWLYTEDTNFIIPSLPIVEKMRDLEFKPKVIWTKNQMRNSILTKTNTGEAAEALAYDLGTQYARWAYMRIIGVEGATHLTEERRNFWSNQIIERLVAYSQQYMPMKDLDKMIPSKFITFILFGEDKLSEDECLQWASFIEKNERGAALSKNCSAGLFSN